MTQTRITHIEAFQKFLQVFTHIPEIHNEYDKVKHFIVNSVQKKIFEQSKFNHVKKYHIYLVKLDDEYYRCIVSNVDNQTITVQLLDIGNTISINIWEENKYKLLYVPNYHRLASIPPQTSAFLLGGVQANFAELYLCNICSDLIKKKIKIFELFRVNQNIQCIKVQTEDGDLSKFLIESLTHTKEISKEETIDSLKNVNHLNDPSFLFDLQYLDEHAVKKPKETSFGFFKKCTEEAKPKIEYATVQGIYLPQKFQLDSEIKKFAHLFKSYKLKIDEYYDVSVVHVINGAKHFVIHLSVLLQDLKELSDKIKNLKLNNFDNEPKVGVPCIVPYHKDGLLYRGILLQNYNVLYIDYGNVETIIKNEIYEMPDILMEYNVFGIHCCLNNINVLDHFKNEDCNLAMTNIAQCQKFRMKVISQADNHFYTCELYHNEKDNLITLIKNELLSTITYTLIDEIKSQDKVIISYIESPKHFYVRKVSRIEEFETMMKALKSSFILKQNDLLKLPEKGKACAVCYENECYRTEIISIEGEYANVLFVDFGYQKNIKLDKLHSIRQLFLDTPIYGIECCLESFENEKCIPESVTKRFKELTHGREFECKIHQQIIDVFFIELIDKTNSNLSVELHKELNKLLCYRLNINSIDTTEELDLSNNDDSDDYEKLEKEVSEARKRRSDERKRQWENMKAYNPSFDGMNKTSNNTKETMKNILELKNPIKKELSYENDPFIRSKNGVFQKEQIKKPNNLCSNSTELKKTEFNKRQNKFRSSFSKTCYGNQSSHKQSSTRDNLNFNLEVKNENYHKKEETIKKSLPNIEENIFKNGIITSQNNYNTTNTYRSSDTIISKNSRQNYFSLGSDQSIQKENIKLPTIEEIIILHWKNAKQFFVRILSDNSLYQTMHYTIQKSCENEKPFIELGIGGKRHIRAGTYWIVRNNDQIYYRAKIIEHDLISMKYKCHLIDTGEIAFIDENNIFLINKAIGKHPVYALQCSLSNFLSVEEVNEFDKYMKDFCESKFEIMCHFNDMSENMYGNLYFVRLYHDFKDYLIEKRLLLVKNTNDINLELLCGQYINAKIDSIIDLLEFQILVDGCAEKLLCSFYDTEFCQTNHDLSKKFKEEYENKHCVINVNNVRSDRVLMVDLLISLLHNNVPKVSICEYPILKNAIKVQITHVLTYNIIFVRTQSVTKDLKDLINDMNTFYESEKKGQRLKEVKLRNIYAKKSSYDQNWYRVRIIAPTNTNTITLFYIDFGYIEVIDKENNSNLFELDASFFTKCAFAIPIIYPVENISAIQNSNKDLISKMFDENKQFYINIHERYKSVLIADFYYTINNDTNNFENLVNLLEAKEKDIDYAKNIIDNLNEQELDFCFDHIIDFGFYNNDETINVDFDKDLQQNMNENKILNDYLMWEQLSYFIDPSLFYHQLFGNIKEFNTMQEDIQIVDKSLPSIANLISGTYCITLNSDNDIWNRAIIIDNEVINVKFIDTGETHILNNDQNIKKMFENLKNIKSFAMTCALPIPPKNMKYWNSEEFNDFINALDKEVKYKIILKNEQKNYIQIWINGENIIEKTIIDNLAFQLQTLESMQKEQCAAEINSSNAIKKFLTNDKCILKRFSRFCKEQTFETSYYSDLTSSLCNLNSLDKSNTITETSLPLKSDSESDLIDFPKYIPLNDDSVLGLATPFCNLNLLDNSNTINETLPLKNASESDLIDFSKDIPLNGDSDLITSLYNLNLLDNSNTITETSLPLQNDSENDLIDFSKEISFNVINAKIKNDKKNITTDIKRRVYNNWKCILTTPKIITLKEDPTVILYNITSLICDENMSEDDKTYYNLSNLKSNISELMTNDVLYILISNEILNKQKQLDFQYDIQKIIESSLINNLERFMPSTSNNIKTNDDFQIFLSQNTTEEYLKDFFDDVFKSIYDVCT